jgi:hypothetical protein
MQPFLAVLRLCGFSVADCQFSRITEGRLLEVTDASSIRVRF